MAAKGREEKKEAMDPVEEIAFLRQKASSLSIRGHYGECAKLIEDHLKMFYFQDRWPENFYSVLQIHKRCYPSLGRPESHEDYLRGLLHKNGVPGIFADFLKPGGAPAEWKGAYFRDKALECRSAGDCENALDYADLLFKMEPHNSGALLIKGLVMEEQGRTKEALECYETALELTPSNLQASQGIARLYGRTDPRKALEYLDQAMEDFPDEDGFIAEKARLLEQLGNRTAALAMWDKAMEVGPYQAAYPYEKAELLLAEGSEVAAIALYRRSVGLNEKHLPSLMRLAALSESKSPSVALEHLAVVLRAEPGNTPAGLLRARLLRKTGDADGAIRQYKEILEREPGSVEALEGMALCYRRPDPEKALDYYGQALAITANSPSCRLGQAEMLDRLGRREEAIEGYKAASRLDRQNPKPLGALGRLYAESEPATSLGFYDSALRLHKENPEYHTGRAEAQLRLGREDEAVGSLSEACRYDPGNAVLHERVGRILEKAGRRASSVAHYREAVHLNPALDRSHSGIARQLAHTEPHTAITHINTAIYLDPTNASYYYWKARIMARLGGDHYAMEQLQRAMEQQTDSELQAEISELLKGDHLRVALMTLNRAIELDPRNNACLCLRGQLLFDIGQPVKAMHQFEQLLGSDPNNHEALFGLGRIHSIRGEDKEALGYLDRAIVLCPEAAAYRAMKARCLSHDEERYEEALACYDAAIPLDPNAWEPVLEKAQLMDRRGDSIGAMDSYRRCLLIHSACQPAAARMGELLADENPEAALHYFQHAAELGGDSWYFYGWIARVLFRLGREEEARQSLGRAVELVGCSAGIWLELARIFLGADRDRAIEYVETSLSINEMSAEAHILKGDILLEQGEIDRASDHYKRAAQIDRENDRATARAARVMLLRGDRQALHMIDLALGSNRFNIDYLCLKADILTTLFEKREADAIQAIDRAVELSPDRTDLRERLVELLRRKRSLIRFAFEKSRLERLRRSQGHVLTEAAELPFKIKEPEQKEALEPPAEPS